MDVEHLLGGERVLFYFVSEHRIDFRGSGKCDLQAQQLSHPHRNAAGGAQAMRPA